MYKLLLGIGVIAGLLFYEATGLYPGGVIVSGYLALYIDQPLRILATVAQSLLIFLLMELLSRWLIIYGRQYFGLCIVIGIGIKIFFELLAPNLAGHPPRFVGIGYIIPGIIANNMYKQGVATTIISMLVVSIILYIIIKLTFPASFPHL